jgi:hypothetical protein
MIEKTKDGKFKVQSFTDPEVFYEVTLEPEESCSCPIFRSGLTGMADGASTSGQCWCRSGV